MTTEDAKRGKKVVERLAERLVLKLYRVGCDEINFGIIISLPLTAKEIEKKFELTAMPVNKRVNDLMKMGLIRRDKRGEQIYRTKMSDEFMGNIESLKKDVIFKMAEMV